MIKKSEYLIKNIHCSENLIIYDTNINKFLFKSELDINKSVTNNLISKFKINNIKDRKYKLKFKNLIREDNIIVYLIFSSDKINNPLFFNIIIKEDKNKPYQMLKISSIKFSKEYIECSKDETLSFDILKETNINKIKFSKKPDNIFYFSNVQHEPCKIKIDDTDYSVYGFNKSPVINKKNINKNENYCYYNPNLNNSWKVDILKNPSCKHIRLNKNEPYKMLNILNKCSFQFGPFKLLNKLPDEKKVIDLYKKEITELKTEQTKNTIDQKKKAIEDKIGNKQLKDEFDVVNNKLDNESKVELANILINFSNYLEEGNFSNITQARRSFSRVLQTVKDRHDEYKLAGKYNICKGDLLKQLNDVSNVIDCQSHCNANDICKNISYNKSAKKCNLYKNCKLLYDDKYNTYTKKSLLKESGYNIYKQYYKKMEPIIDHMPPALKFLYYISAIIVIICLSILLYRFLKIFTKIFLCVYYGTCYIPTELLDFENTGILDQRYI
tara:strand:+ start:1125 stop:2618 length:1494 start_codon:yes stop_codon:yes gene_type:complete